MATAMPVEMVLAGVRLLMRTLCPVAGRHPDGDVRFGIAEAPADAPKATHPMRPTLLPRDWWRPWFLLERPLHGGQASSHYRHWRFVRFSPRRQSTTKAVPTSRGTPRKDAASSCQLADASPRTSQ